MVTVALAGATTGFGLTVLRQFIHLNSHLPPKAQHRIILLSRSPQPHFTSLGVDVRPTDYTSHTSLLQSLSGVHTVLSLIGANGLESAQLALLRASVDAPSVKRFAPSEFAGSTTTFADIDVYAPKQKVWNAVKESGLEYTRFACGLFMAVLGTGTPKPPTEVGRREGRKTGEEEALSGLRPWNYIVNIVAGTADLPGDGSGKLVFTDMRDVATFTFRALELETWPEEMGMRGDVKSYREVVDILERVSGRKLLVRENSFEELLAQADRDPKVRFYNQMRVCMERDGGGMAGNELNRAFPDVKPVTVEEYVEKWWGGVKLGEPSWQEDKSFGAEDL